METGFSLAGQPIAQWKQRESSVRFRETKEANDLQPLQEGESGDAKAEDLQREDEMWDGGDEERMKELSEKYQQFRDKCEEYFDDENGRSCKMPPVVEPPRTFTRVEYERHQITHTPFAPWCKHCIAARAVRRKHPSKGRRVSVVPVTESGQGPMKLFMDYMYLHERRSAQREAAENPLHMIMVDHKHGRCWAYRVPNNGVLENVCWLPERISKIWITMG